jgi:hypothetical protein
MTGGIFGGKWKRRFCEIDSVMFAYYNNEAGPGFKEKVTVKLIFSITHLKE